jgi:hypothetical protein
MRLLVLVSVACVLALATGAAAKPPGWVDHRHPDFGWRASYPARFKAADFTVRGRVTWRGTTIANFGPPPVSVSPSERVDFPPNGVVIRFYHRDGGPALGADYRDSRFPLALNQFGKSGPGWRSLGFQAGAIQYIAIASIGSQASRADVEALREIVQSFKPAPLRTRSTSGCRFYVLRYLRGYRVESVRRYEPRELPDSPCHRKQSFYLVRTARTVYTIAWSSTLVGGYKHCSVRFDRLRSQFLCPNGARWNLRGRVVRNPDPEQFKNDPLDMRHAVIAYDGHVLASP